MKFPEKYRLQGTLNQNGTFKIPYIRNLNGFEDKSDLFVVASNGLGWEHCSVSIISANSKIKRPRLPRWDEMCFIKELFWEDDEVVMQLHPKKSDYVNNFEVLHLWKPLNEKIPTPLKILV
jgi:hypothetical protein